MILLIALQGEQLSSDGENNHFRGVVHGTQIEGSGDGGRTRATLFPLVRLLTGLPVPAMLCHGVSSFFVLSFLASIAALGIQEVDPFVALELDMIIKNEHQH